MNTNFEWELKQKGVPHLESSFSERHRSLFPLTSHFAKEGDTIFPDPPKPGQVVDAWAPSRMVQIYAKKHQLKYEIPDWEIIKKLASKATAHQISPLPGSSTLNDENDLELWLKHFPMNHVFKSYYGFSGTGHFFSPKNLPYPVLAEPWVKRDLDFSTQWFIDGENVHYLGACLLFSDERGKYKGNKVGRDEKTLFGKYYPFLEDHLFFVSKYLSTLEGFFGHMGVDSFIYNNTLQPICEINPRKTMGYMALKLFSKFQDASFLTLHFDKELKFNVE